MFVIVLNIIFLASASLIVSRFIEAYKLLESGFDNSGTANPVEECSLC